MKKSNALIAVIDYGVCNLFSIYKACRKFSNHVIITEDPKIIDSADAIIMPGVGSYESGMDGLRVRNLVGSIKSFADSGRPILGICLGAQLLLSRGYEFGDHRGLDIVSGNVVKFSGLEECIKIPQVGWNKVALSKRKDLKGIFQALNANTYLYFVHSFIMEPKNKNDILATTTYGGHDFCSIIKKGNVYGCQFHPEKSGVVGLSIIKEFINKV